MIHRINTLFPLWAVILSTFAYFSPDHFTPFAGLISYLLMGIMLFMGMTLSKIDFVRVIRHPKVISMGLFLQYSVMPLAALLVSKLFALSDELTVGMVLVGSVSGGTASNLITYLAKGDVALSITMTTVSTLLSVAATPFLTYLYLDQSLDVPIIEMLLSILKIVVFPVFAGVML
ncbi:bile acid:sodium symporter family protein, partial [Sulfuricurvum sp.]|uniref:bile acid:sodium symporter family protein n=1 Tax=Sulfuricurvum sp. TaxID=2025608 RepID=UPI00261424CF